MTTRISAVNLKSYTLYSLLSITYLFFIRTVNSFLPLFFTSEVVGKGVQVLSLMAHAVILLFYISFLTQYIQPAQKWLRWATILSVAAMAILSLFYLAGVLTFFPGLTSTLYKFSPFLYRSLHSSPFFPNLPLLSPGFAWINTLIFIFFLTAFYRESEDMKHEALKRATYYAIGGHILLFLIQSLLILAQIFGNGLGWMLPHSLTLLFLFLPVFSIVFLVKFNFFLQFYRILKD
jgi:hypothetical protein